MVKSYKKLPASKRNYVVPRGTYSSKSRRNAQKVPPVVNLDKVNSFKLARKLAAKQVVPFSHNGTLTHAYNTTLAYDGEPSFGNLFSSDLAAYQTIYDMYRILKVRIRIRSPFTQATTGALTGSYWNVYSVIDKTDSNSLTSINQALAYTNCVIKKSTDSYCVDRTYVPGVTIVDTDTNGNSFHHFLSKPWIETAAVLNNKDVAQLGLKVFFDVNTDVTLNYEVYIQMIIEFKNKN